MWNDFFICLKPSLTFLECTRVLCTLSMQLCCHMRSASIWAANLKDGAGRRIAVQECASKKAPTMMVASVKDSCLLVAGATRYAFSLVIQDYFVGRSWTNESNYWKKNQICGNKISSLLDLWKIAFLKQVSCQLNAPYFSSKELHILLYLIHASSLM